MTKFGRTKEKEIKQKEKAFYEARTAEKAKKKAIPSKRKLGANANFDRILNKRLKKAEGK